MSGMNKSVSTLSKKQKMRLKKSQKRYIITKQPSFIEVISSSGNQQQYANNITKSQKQQQDNQPPKQQLKNKSENRYNNFNFEKIKKSDLSHRQRKPILLQYQQCEDIKDITQYQGRSLISYRKFGQEKLQMISQNHLKNRIDKFNQQIQKIQAQKQKIQAQKDQQEQNQQQFQQGCEEIKNQQPLQNQKKNNFNKALRYFDIVPQKKIDNDSNVQSNDSNDDDNRIVKCFRCGQMGHIARNCYEEAQKIKCMFCLGEHHHSQCTDVLCFKCSNPGHVSQNCTNPGKVCRRCKKRGHIERNCGSILLMDYSNSNDKEIRQKFGVDNLRKLKCLCNCRKPKGHFNCFSYHENPPKIYN